MKDFKVKLVTPETIIEGANGSFKVSVIKNADKLTIEDKAVMEATLYKEEGCFIPTINYLFEAIDSEGQPALHVDVQEFNSAIDFFFTSLLDTDHYLKSIPRFSSLCPAPRKQFQF